MPIRPPSLDDRRFDDLVAELLARIPAHTPEWTNPRTGDPGRTLIELFAWLGDALLYRANLIPERQRLAFLRLLGQPLRAARPARGLVTLTLKESENINSYSLLPGSTLTGPQPFEARHEITVLPLTLGAFYKKSATAGEVAPNVVEALSTLHGQGAGMKLYIATPLFTGGAAEAKGFDGFATPADRCVWLGLFARKAGKLTEQEAMNKAVLAALDAAAGGNRPLLNVGFVPALPPADAFPITNGAARGAVPHLWEITANTTKQIVDDQHAWTPDYIALDEISDSTRGLTQPGVVRLALPLSKWLHPPTSNVRVDMQAGVGDRPPRLDDEEMAARLLAWIRLRPKPGASPPSPVETRFSSGTAATAPTSTTPAHEIEHLWVSWLGINALEIEQLVSRSNAIIGESDGTADQEFQLPATSVEPETLQIKVEGDDSLSWMRVDDLVALDRDARSARDARVFQLDAEAGTIHFGDGVRGRIPPAGARIIVAQMRYGGGEAGNLPPGTLKKVAAKVAPNQTDVGAKFDIGQPLALAGGADAEELQEAERRIPATFRHRERAVTRDDYYDAAMRTPGVQVGRVEVLPLFKPQQRMDNLPGIVTVMALPDAPLGPAPNPRADRPFLETVHAWLDNRRPLSTELYVIGCEYIPVSLSVAISLREDAEPTTTEQAVKAALRRVLWPLPKKNNPTGGGFDGQGWKLMHEISNRELAVEVARVTGVSEVAGLNLFTVDSGSGKWRVHEHAADGKEQDIPLEKWQLPELHEVTVVFEDTAPLTLIAPNPYADDKAVAVPVVPRLC